MRCAVIFTKMTRHGDIKLGTPYSESHFGGSHYVRTANDSCFLPAGRYTVSATIGIEKTVTVQVHAFRDDGGFDEVLPESGKANLPYTFDLAGARSLRFEFGVGSDWTDEDIETAGAVTNVTVHDENGSTNDEYESRVIRPDELTDNAAIAQAVNAKSSITLEIYPQYDAWGFCERSITYVKVLDLDRPSDRTIFRGRVSAVSDVMDSSGKIYQTITCVSAADFLEDFQWAGYTSSRPLYSILADEFDYFSRNVDDFRKIYTDSDSFPIYPNQDFYAYGMGEQYTTAFAGINKLLTSGDNIKIAVTEGQTLTYLAGTYAIEWRERYKNDRTYFDVSKQFGENRDTAFVIGENLSDIRIEQNTDDGIYTSVLAYSGLNSNGGRQPAREYNYAMAAKYGTGRTLVLQNDSIRCTAPEYEETEWGTLVHTDAWLAMIEAITAYARQEARKLSEPPIRITLTAADLATMGFSGYEPFEVGNSHPLVYPPGGYFGQRVRITGIRRRLSDGRIEQITIESGQQPGKKSSSSLSYYMARLEEATNRYYEDQAAQNEIIETKIDETLDEVLDPKIDEVLAEVLDGATIVRLTKAEYDALGTYDDTVFYNVDNNGTNELYIGADHISSGGGGGGTIETAAILSSEQMVYWAPDHELVPVEFRGGAHVYYSQPPAKIVIQKQHAIVGTPTAALVAANDLYEEIEFEFSRSAATGKQKLKFYVTQVQIRTNNNVDYNVYNTAVMCSQVEGGSEILIGDYTAGTFVVPVGTQTTWNMGLVISVSQLSSSSNQPINPVCTIYVAAKLGDSLTILGVPNISGSFFNPNTTLEFLNDAERNFALGVAGIVEPVPEQSGGGEGE